MYTTLKTIVLAVCITGCASIVSKSIYPVSINSTPSAKIEVTNSSGQVVFEGQTPVSVELESGKKFFKRESYKVKFSQDGYDSQTVPIYFKMDGWYWANLIIGGVIGMLIVDPATGAMYKLDTEFVNVTLLKGVGSLNDPKLKIYGINDIPPQWERHLIRIK